jgi:hypothetical protein
LMVAPPIQPTDEVYLSGSFNRWQPTEEWKMKYDAESNEFRLKPLIKEGRYVYSYDVLEPRTGVKKNVSSPFASRNQEYYAFVFVMDFNRQFWRLSSTVNVKE